MSKRKRCSGYVAWDEQIVCAERGSRVVHYHLKDGFGSSILAVVGTERSIRHMWYVPTDELLRAFGTGGVINGNKQWRSRREVVALLASLVSNTETYSSKDELAASLKVNVPRTVKPQRSEIVWSGDAWFCVKKLKHYPSFSIHGVKIDVHSFVSILTGEGGFYIGYLEDLYEDKKGMEKVRVRWFINNLDDQQLVSQLKLRRKEVLITPYVQVISAKCVIGQATVLTPRDYEKISAFATQTSSAGIFMCCRQVKDNKVTPFALTKLRGYLNQAIFSLLYRNYLICKENPISSELSMEDDEDFTSDYTLRDNAGTDKYRNWEVIRGYGYPDFRPSIPQTPAVKYGPTYPGLKFKVSNIMNKMFLQSEPKVSFSSEVNQKIELLCEDSGIRGCWFRCQILQRSDKHFRVMYNDILDVDEFGNLKEWVSAVKIAPLDKLGIRCPGRNRIRPPPPKDVINSKFEVGMPVDAWWCDGWWEGIVTQVDSSQLSNLVIYFPGEDKLMRFQRKYVRRSRDWVDNRWVDLKPKPEILAFLAANACDSFKSSLCSIIRSPPEELPSILTKDVLAPSKEGFGNLTKNSTVIDKTRHYEGGDAAISSCCGEKS